MRHIPTNTRRHPDKTEKKNSMTDSFTPQREVACDTPIKKEEVPPRE